MRHDSRLIRRRYARPLHERAGWGLVTALFWAAYAYMMLPLFTLLLWLAGVRTTFDQLYLRTEAAEPFLLLSLPLLALLAAALLIGWAELQRRRFGGRDKRSAPRPVPDAEVVVALGGTLELAERARTARIVVLHMGDDARPVGATVALPAQRAAASATADG